jgi:hypothetical protein
MFDEPVEHATEWIFYNAFKTFGGEKAVEGRPVTGAKELRKEENQDGGKLKELWEEGNLLVAKIARYEAERWVFAVLR